MSANFGANTVRVCQPFLAIVLSIVLIGTFLISRVLCLKRNLAGCGKLSAFDCRNRRNQNRRMMAIDKMVSSHHPSCFQVHPKAPLGA
jgi:hypothetical protein